MTNKTFKKDDLAKMRFTEDNQALVADSLLSYSSALDMINSLIKIDEIEDEGNVSITAENIETVDVADYASSTKTIEQMFDDAIAYCTETEHAVKQPAFVHEVWNLLEALRYAKADAVSGEDLFDCFVAYVGHWWVLDYCGYDRAISILRKVSDAFA